MNISIGKTTFGRKNLSGSGALLASLTAIAILAGVGIWQATNSASETTVAPLPEARSVDFTRPSFEPTYVYIVDSQAQADALYQAAFEVQMSFESSGTFNSDFRVINIGTPEGLEAYRIMNAELNQVAMEAPDLVSHVHVIDLTAQASTSVQTPVRNEIDRPGVPTYFYIVESQEQATKVLQADVMSAQEAMMVGEALSPHHTVIVDVSTLEGAQLLNTIEGHLHEFWADPSAEKPWITVIDARKSP